MASIQSKMTIKSFVTVTIKREISIFRKKKKLTHFTTKYKKINFQKNQVNWLKIGDPSVHIDFKYPVLKLTK